MIFGVCLNPLGTKTIPAILEKSCYHSNENNSCLFIMNLSQLTPSESAIVLSIELPFEVRERLAALGVKAGRRLSLVHRLGAHGPLQVRAGSTDFILRARDAAAIKIRR